MVVVWQVTGEAQEDVLNGEITESGRLAVQGEVNQDLICQLHGVGDPNLIDRELIETLDDLIATSHAVFVKDGTLCAVGDAPVDGDADIYAAWNKSITLVGNVVLTYRQKMPDGCPSAYYGAAPTELLEKAEGSWAIGGHIGNALVQGACLVVDPALQFVLCGGGEFVPLEVWDDTDLPSVTPDLVVLVFISALRIVLVSISGTAKKAVIPEHLWPSEKVTPIVCLCTEIFNGFEELESTDLPLSVTALSGNDVLLDAMIGTILGQNGCLRPALVENDVLADEQMAVARAAAMVDEIGAAVDDEDERTRVAKQAVGDFQSTLAKLDQLLEDDSDDSDY